MNRDSPLSLTQGAAALGLMFSDFRFEASLALWLASLWQLWRFQGPYNGGADKLVLLALTCMCLVHTATNSFWQEIAFGYFAIQVVLSYTVSGWVKLSSRDWRNGQALSDVFAYSAYPVSENLRALADRKEAMIVGSWLVILLEVLFPLAFFSHATLICVLVLAAGFHVANAVLFGLNRFLWAWISTYPVLFWAQARLHETSIL